MKILSWNIDCKIGQNGVWNYIRTHIKPDFALLQECRVPVENFEVQNNLLLNVIGGTRNWGSCIYSKDCKVDEVSFSPEYRGWTTLGEMTPLHFSKPILLISVHAKLAGVPFVVPHLKEMFSKLLNVMKEYENLIIAGDFNAARLFDEVYPQYPAHTKHKLLFDWLENELGLFDCHYKLNGKEVQTMRGKSKYPYQNDHIFVSKSLLTRLKSCTVLANEEIYKLSDHNPVVAEFKVGDN